MLLLATGTMAQKRADTTISGKLTDEGGNAIPYAAVAVQSIEEGSPLTGAATDFDGNFSVEVKPGTYNVTITFLSFEEWKREGLEVGMDGVKLGTIVMKPSSELVDEVVITGERNQMELMLDKRVFNVAKDPTNAGSNAQDILDNLPSINVDMDGNVNMRGSQNVRILIDGKPSGLTGISTADALRQIPGSIIERVEVVTNASARYDAEGEAGIINIVLKKDRRAGLNGAFEVSTGWPHNHGASFNLNYRKGIVNLFTGMGVQYNRSPGSGNSYQKFIQEDTTFAYDRKREQMRGGLTGNFRLGADFNINPKTSITASGMVSRHWQQNDYKLTYTDFDSNDQLTDLVVRSEDEEAEKDNIEANLNFSRTFKSDEQKLTADVRWFISSDHETSDIDERGDTYGAPLIQRIDNLKRERSWLFQTDYVHPLSQKVKLETGFRATLRRIDNDYLVEQQDTTLDYFPLPDFDNNFIFDENVYAGYLMAGAKLGKWGLQGGVRGEFTDLTTTLVKDNYSNNRKYFNVFPSAHFSYEINKGNTLQLSYSLRISRPHFRNLIPFFGLADNRNIRSGNPDLNPEFTHSFEFGHLKNFNKGTLLSNIYYRHRVDVVQNIAEPDSNGIILSYPINIGKQNAVGLEFNFNYELMKWWRITTSVNTYYAKTEGEYQDQVFDVEAFTTNVRFTTKFTILKKLDLQSSFNYNAPEATPQGRTLSMYAWDAGASMDVLKGNGTITLSVRDILNSRVRRWEVDLPELQSTSDFQWRVRQISLSFSYRLNQKKQRPKPDRGGGEGGGGGEDF
jgi:outer membrane receptor protein involved in Fe transport